jgi:hypothetical protein
MVTCKTKGTQQANLFSVFFLFRSVSLQIVFGFTFFFSTSDGWRQGGGTDERGASLLEKRGV